MGEWEHDNNLPVVVQKAALKSLQQCESENASNITQHKPHLSIECVETVCLICSSNTHTSVYTMKSTKSAINPRRSYIVTVLA